MTQYEFRLSLLRVSGFAFRVSGQKVKLKPRNEPETRNPKPVTNHPSHWMIEFKGTLFQVMTYNPRFS